MCREEKIISTHNKAAKQLFDSTFLKNYKSRHGRCRSSHRKCSVRKSVLENFANFTGKHLCWSLFYEVAGLQPERFLKRDSNTSASL